MTLNHPVLQSVLTAAATVVAGAAAVFAWQQVEIGREHNRLSVRPVLQITPYLEGKDGKNGLYLTNDGLGPAVVKRFSVSAGNVVAEGFHSDRWAELLATVGANPACFATGWPKGETTIKAGAELPLVIVTKAQGMELCQIELLKLIVARPVQVTIGYESMYGEREQVVADSRIVSKTLEESYGRLVR